METYLYNAYTTYLNTLTKTGYIKDKDINSLLIITFMYNLINEDYRGIISRKDYSIIEKSISCLYGRSCLLPYREYINMGKLHIGEYTELAHKLCNLDNFTKDIDNRVQQNNNTINNNSLNLNEIKIKVTSNEESIKNLENKTDRLVEDITSVDELIHDEIIPGVIELFDATSQELERIDNNISDLSNTIDNLDTEMRDLVEETREWVDDRITGIETNFKELEQSTTEALNVNQEFVINEITDMGERLDNVERKIEDIENTNVIKIDEDTIEFEDI